MSHKFLTDEPFWYLSVFVSYLDSVSLWQFVDPSQLELSEIKQILRSLASQVLPAPMQSIFTVLKFAS